MKNTVIIALAVAAGIGTSMAATSVAIGNLDTSAPPNFTGVPIVDNAGAPIAFSWGAGIFAPGTDFGADLATVQSNYTANGSAAPSNPSGLGLFGPPVGDAATAVDSSDAFTGNPIYVVIGAGGDLGAAADWIVLEVAQNWQPEVQGVGGSVSVNLLDPAAYTIVRGNAIAVAADGYANPFTSLNGGPAITFIPEPSTSLLAGFAGLALLIRRKR